MKERKITSTKNNHLDRIMTGSEIVVNALIQEGVDIIFGYPGGVLLDIYDVIYHMPKIRHILVRHEQGATHAADGYARATGKPGVVLVTSGPGATNTVTGIATAYTDSIPLVVFTGQVPTVMIGNDAFQEADIIGITRPITKHSYLVRDVDLLQQTIQEAFYLAATGRPGPVLIDLPRDILRAKTIFRRRRPVRISGYNPVYEGHQQQIEKAADLINKSKRPLIYAGGGVNIGNAADSLRSLAIAARIPVTTTLMGIGSFPEDHDLSLGMVGMHGTWCANMAISQCDLLIAVGARFDDRVTGKIEDFSVRSKKIHIDIDPSSISKNIKVDIPIVGDAAHILPELKKLIKSVDNEKWLQKIRNWKKEHPLVVPDSTEYIMPQYIIKKLSEITNREAIIVTDVGQNQMWAAQYYSFKNPRSILSSGGLGTMGYGLPASIGAAVGRPDRTVVCITGDGGFQMNIQELATAVYYKIPVKIIILNNGYLGMVRQWQDLFYGKRYSHTCIKEGSPDFIKLAESYGAIGMRIKDPEEVEKALRQSLDVNDHPVVMDFIIHPEENVFPMVPAGAPLNEMIEKNRR